MFQCTGLTFNFSTSVAYLWLWVSRTWIYPFSTSCSLCFPKCVSSCDCEWCESKGRIWTDFYWEIGGHQQQQHCWFYLAVSRHEDDLSTLGTLPELSVHYQSFWLHQVRVTSGQCFHNSRCTNVRDVTQLWIQFKLNCSVHVAASSP